MRNAFSYHERCLFLVENDGKSMRNTIFESYFSLFTLLNINILSVKDENMRNDFAKSFLVARHSGIIVTVYKE